MRSSTVEVREACERDAGSVAELLSELGYPTVEATTVERLRRPGELVLVAEDEGQVIGLAVLATSRVGLEGLGPETLAADLQPFREARP